MARDRIVSRTITETLCTVLTCTKAGDKVTTGNVAVVVPSAPSDPAKLDKVLHEMLDRVNGADFTKMVQLLYTEKRETLYGMTEADFLKYAVPMTDRFTLSKGVKAEDNGDTAEGANA